MGAKKADQTPIRSLRLSEEAVEELLNQLDRNEARAGDSNRKSPRFGFRIKSCVVQLQQPGASTPIPYAVSTRNVSAGGLAFLHGGFVHPGTRCVVQLVSRSGAWSDIPGAVVRCEHVEGVVHQVGVRFDQPIDPGEYCAAAQVRTVLVVDDDESSLQIAEFYLKKLNTEVTKATSGAAALEITAEREFSAVFMDVDMPEMDGIETVKRLRAAGYRNPILAVTALDSPEHRERCLNAGFDAFLAKPYTRDELVKTLDLIDHEPLISTLENDPDARELIASFVARLPKLVREIEEACKQEDPQQMMRLVRSLRSQGSSVGFEPISAAAAEVERKLTSGVSCDVIREQVQELVRWCLLARAGNTIAPQEEAPAADEKQAVAEGAQADGADDPI